MKNCKKMLALVLAALFLLTTPAAAWITEPLLPSDLPLREQDRIYRQQYTWNVVPGRVLLGLNRGAYMTAKELEAMLSRHVAVAQVEERFQVGGRYFYYVTLQERTKQATLDGIATLKYVRPVSSVEFTYSSWGMGDYTRKYFDYIREEMPPIFGYPWGSKPILVLPGEWEPVPSMELPWV